MVSKRTHNYFFHDLNRKFMVYKGTQPLKKDPVYMFSCCLISTAYISSLIICAMKKLWVKSRKKELVMLSFICRYTSQRHKTVTAWQCWVVLSPLLMMIYLHDVLCMKLRQKALLLWRFNTQIIIIMINDNNNNTTGARGLSAKCNWALCIYTPCAWFTRRVVAFTHRVVECEHGSGLCVCEGVNVVHKEICECVYVRLWQWKESDMTGSWGRVINVRMPLLSENILFSLKKRKEKHNRCIELKWEMDAFWWKCVL